MASEGQQRKMARDITGDDLVAEKGAFTFALNGGRDEIREVPFVYKPNLLLPLQIWWTSMKSMSRKSLIIVNVNMNAYTPSSSSGLTWHDGAIPSDEIWIKVGGDKG